MSGESVGLDTARPPSAQSGRTRLIYLEVPSSPSSELGIRSSRQVRIGVAKNAWCISTFIYQYLRNFDLGLESACLHLLCMLTSPLWLPRDGKARRPRWPNPQRSDPCSTRPNEASLPRRNSLPEGHAMEWVWPGTRRGSRATDRARRRHPPARQTCATIHLGSTPVKFGRWRLSALLEEGVRR